MNQIGSGSSSLVTFYVGACKFGIPIISIKEVQRLLDITPVAGAHPFFQGLANLRGKIITVVDVGYCFDIPAEEENTQRKLLILKTNQELRRLNLQQTGLNEESSGAADNVAILVSRVSETIEFRAEELKPVPVNFDKSFQSLLRGVVEDGDELMFVLDMNALFAKMIEYCESN